MTTTQEFIETLLHHNRPFSLTPDISVSESWFLPLYTKLGWLRVEQIMDIHITQNSEENNASHAPEIAVVFSLIKPYAGDVEYFSVEAECPFVTTPNTSLPSPNDVKWIDGTERKVTTAVAHKPFLWVTQ